MHSPLSRALLGAAVLLALVPRWSDADAQSAPTAPTTSDADRQEEASKLTDEAIAAQDAKDYAKAIALYKRAYQLIPHPILEFNIGQTYWLAGDVVEAEKFYRRYLERDPNGPGAPIARVFLASLPVSTSPNSGPAASPAVPRTPESTASSTLAAISPVAHVPEPSPTTAGGARVTTNVDGDSRAEPLTSTPVTPGDDKDSTATLTPDLVRARDEQVKRANDTKYAGIAMMSIGGVLTVGGFGFISQKDDKFGLSVGIVGLGFLGGGFLAFEYSRQQRNVATSSYASSSQPSRSIAWAPAVGPGFAGVALAGSLP